MDEYNWDDWDAQAAEYLSSPDYTGGTGDYYMDPNLYASMTSGPSQWELNNWYGDSSFDVPTMGSLFDTGYELGTPMSAYSGVDPQMAFLTTLQMTGDLGLAEQTAQAMAEQYSTKPWSLYGEDEFTGLDQAVNVNNTGAPGFDFNNPEQLQQFLGEVAQQTGSDDFYRDLPELNQNELAKTLWDNMPMEEKAKYYADKAGSAIGGFFKQGAPVAAKAAQGTSITRNPDGSITIGGGGQQQPQRQASPAQGALAMAKALGLMYQGMKGKDGSPTKARASTVQSSGPQYSGERPTRTLYARGGKVEVPASVSGGLLPIALKLVEGLTSAPKGLISGSDNGQADTVEAMLSPGEYVIDAEIVAALGDGNTEAGAKKLDDMRYNIRKHKRSGGLAQIAPKTKSLDKYMKG